MNRIVSGPITVLLLVTLSAAFVETTSAFACDRMTGGHAAHPMAIAGADSQAMDSSSTVHRESHGTAAPADSDSGPADSPDCPFNSSGTMIGCSIGSSLAACAPDLPEAVASLVVRNPTYAEAPPSLDRDIPFHPPRA